MIRIRVFLFVVLLSFIIGIGCIRIIVFYYYY